MMEIPLEDAEAFARVGEAISKMARVRIIRELSTRKTATLSELERLMIKKYGGPQKSTIQLHLAKLESAGIVETRKEREGPRGQTIVRISFKLDFAT
jgi:DNA-binding transcriptional ArsR family regulator